MRRLLLFDVDMTLLSSGGAGRAAMTRALMEEWSIEDGLSGIELAGRTDRAIITDALAAAGIRGSQAALEATRRRYVRQLSLILCSPGSSAVALEGVEPLLCHLNGDPSVCMALLTGNWREGAYLKLASCGIADYFCTGSFGDDFSKREDLFPSAIERACRVYEERFGPSRVTVIGDTPHDVAVGLAHGARTVAVATGSFGTERLLEAGADEAVESLADFEAICRLLTGRELP